MAEGGYLAKHRIVRNAIKKDLLYFAIPALLIFTAGLAVSVYGWVGLLETIWNLIRQPRSIVMLSAPHLVGIALFVIGFAILLTGHITLWRNYSSTLIIREDHQLITHGIYRFTRNPIYLGGIMAITGLPVYVASLYGFLTSLLLIPLILNRIRLEEKLLAEEFQDAYQKYKESTKKLVPFIY